MPEFARQPIPSHIGPPASATPLRDYLAQPDVPGALDDYVVIPRVLAEAMPLAWQGQLRDLLAELHQAHRQAPWPRYAVAALVQAPLTGCNEEQLRAVDVAADLDEQGDQLTYRDTRTGQVIEDPENRLALIRVDDPLRR